MTDRRLGVPGCLGGMFLPLYLVSLSVFGLIQFIDLCSEKLSTFLYICL